jgi:hypothetical protein
MKFRTTLLQAEGKSATAIPVPPEIIEGLGAGKKPPVKVTINGYSYRSTVAVLGGKYMIGVAAEHRRKARRNAGDAIDVALEADRAPREVEAPPDLAAALEQSRATAAFARLAYTYRKEHARDIAAAKSPETRQRRIKKATAQALAARG